MTADTSTKNRRFVRARSPQDGDLSRTHAVRIRLTRRSSAELASLQGLCYRHGKRETLASLWESVCMPALRSHVRPYADKAKAERERTRAGKEDRCPTIDK